MWSAPLVEGVSMCALGRTFRLRSRRPFARDEREFAPVAQVQQRRRDLGRARAAARIGHSPDLDTRTVRVIGTEWVG